MADSAPKSLLDIQKEQEQEASQARLAGGGDYGGRGHNQQQQQQRGFGGGGSGRGGGGRGGNGRGGGGGGRGSSRRIADRSSLPIEGGVICSMKDSFGFIHCADREDELFFHFSEVTGCHPADLHMDDEVQFRVGVSQTNNNDSAKKYAAYEIKRVPAGTVVWEVEEDVGVRFKGVVERPIRTERGSGIQTVDGLIKVLSDDEAAAGGEANPDEEGGKNKTNEEPGSAIRVRFRAADVPAQQQSGSKPNNNAGRLFRGDIVEFNIFTEKRTKLKYAKALELNQSERDRARAAKEQRLLEGASSEQGVITSLKMDYGFIRSNRRKEEVYFHISNVQVEDGDPQQNVRDILREGQELEFLVVTEDSNGPKPPRVSARNVRMLPKGTVQFSKALAKGVTGVVVRCPQPPDSSGRGEKWGSILLSEPISVEGDGNNGEGEQQSLEIKNVYLKTRFSPGGTFAIKGSPPGLWIREGDTLLFDVVREMVDNAYFAEPTTCQQPIAKIAEGGDTQQQNEIEGEPAVRLIKLSLVGLAEGVIHTVKEAYGFIHFAERPVDVHFKLYEVLPERLQYDLRRNMGLSSPVNGKPLLMTPGTEVLFDMSVQGTVTSFSTRAKNRHERENLKAQRILFLPPSTIVAKKVLASNVQGVVTKEDPNQPYAGSIDLDHEVESLSLEERHPLVAEMIQNFLDDKDRSSVVFHDLQSLKEDSVITDMIALKGKDALTWSHIPVAGETVYPGRLCIRKEEKGDQHAEATPGNTTEEDFHSDDEANATGSNTNDDNHHGKKKKKKKKKQSKAVKTIRFDKGSLSLNMKDDVPPSIGDIVCFDVVQIRRTGKVNIENLKIITRKVVDHTDNTSTNDSGVGVIKELVPQRQFGFISVVEENSTKREVLFFHYSSVNSSGAPTAENNNHSSNDAAADPNKKINIPLRKGDEVKFDVGLEKNGKRIAVHVEAVPKGTVVAKNNNNNKEQKNVCRGYILVEPSHTEIAGTQSRGKARNKNQGAVGSRWEHVNLDDTPSKNGSSKGDGYILLLEDPMDVFATRVPVLTNESSGAGAGLGTDGAAVGNGEGENAPTTAATTTTENGDSNANPDEQQKQHQQQQQVLKSAIGCHFPYKHPAIANHDPSSHPRRGDLVSFHKVKGSENGVRDIRIISRGSAKLIRGNLQRINRTGGQNGDNNDMGTAKFIPSSGGGGRGAAKTGPEYDVNLYEVVSCSLEVLKENEPVEGVLHDGCIYGICRTCDLYLVSKNSKFAQSHKERPKLNLTVKKDRGGTIMAQSMMAKGPDGTNGFAKGWTRRVSHYRKGASSDEVGVAIATVANGAVDVAGAHSPADITGAHDAGGVGSDADGVPGVAGLDASMFLPAYYTTAAYDDQQPVVMDAGDYNSDDGAYYYYVEE